MVAFELKTRMDTGVAIELKGYLEKGINVLFGPSGSGKTFFLRHLIGLEEGVRLQDGDPIVSPLHKSRTLGYMPQGGGILPGLTILENIYLGRSKDQKPNEALKEQMESMGLKFYGDERSDKLSGGERLRLAMIRAMVDEPEFLILDEPFSGLDPYYGQVCRQLLTELLDLHNRYVLFTTHELEDAKMQGANLLLINNGEIRKMESAAEIRDHFFNPKP